MLWWSVFYCRCWLLSEIFVACRYFFFGAYLLEVVCVVVGVSVSCIPHAFIAGAARCILVCLPESSAFLFCLPLEGMGRLSCVKGQSRNNKKEKNWFLDASFVDLVPVFWDACNEWREIILLEVFIKFLQSFVPRMSRKIEKIRAHFFCLRLAVQRYLVASRSTIGIRQICCLA